ncbi:hypothetical protein E4U12_000337 [Claviceps purpurea]|nr:hypothetical protein E4U12_000337 [Claviceps purpurea]
MGQVSLARSRKLGTKTLLSELVLRKHDLALVHDDHSEIFEFRPGPEKVKTIESKVPGKKKGKAKNDESSDHEDMGFDFEDPGLLPGSNTPRSAEKVRVSPKLFTQSPVILDSGVAAGPPQPSTKFISATPTGWIILPGRFSSRRNFSLQRTTATPRHYLSQHLRTTSSSTTAVRLFGDRRLDAFLAQLRFLSYVLQLSETFTWESCLEYAMRRLTAIRDNDVHDVVR